MVRTGEEKGNSQPTSDKRSELTTGKRVSERNLKM